jgi:hypothetical protein
MYTELLHPLNRFKKSKVAGGEYLNTSALISSMPYAIQGVSFKNDFNLLQSKSYGMILGCDWIKQHNPIALDLRDTSRHLIIQKNGTTRHNI